MARQGFIATVGMFDGVHLGHRSLLMELKDNALSRGLKTAVFTFDRHPSAIIDPEKTPPALTSVSERVELLRSVGIDDVEVLCFDEALRSLDARSFMTLLRDRYGVKALLMGFNHSFGSDRLKDFDDYAAIGASLGVEVVRAREWSHEACACNICSSAIRQALLRGDVELATLMLGRPYSFKGVVAEGRRIGRTIGFPTANIETEDRPRLVPAPGVYAVDVKMPGGVVRRGMLNIGVRPTVDHSPEPKQTIEVHVIDWSGDIYGKELNLSFISRLRGEMRFDSLEELRKRLESDREEALKA